MTTPSKISFGDEIGLQNYLDTQIGTENNLTEKIVNLIKNNTFFEVTFESQLGDKLCSNGEFYSKETIKPYADAIIRYYDEKILDFTKCTVDDIKRWLGDHPKTKECTMFIEQISKICAGKSFDKASFVNILQGQLLKEKMSERADRIGDLWVSAVENYAKALSSFSYELKNRKSLMREFKDKHTPRNYK
jgi:hypothetical protein